MEERGSPLSVSLTREIVFGVFLPIVMPIFMGLDGLLWSFPLADILTFIIAVVIMIKVYKELNVQKLPNSL